MMPCLQVDSAFEYLVRHAEDANEDVQYMVKRCTRGGAVYDIVRDIVME